LTARCERPEFHGNGITELWHEALKPLIDRRFGSAEGVPADLRQFVSDVNIALWQADADKKLMERAYKLSCSRLILANEDLRETQDGLEKMVVKRTEELSSINIELNKEISERRQAEKSLRGSEADLRKLAERLSHLASELSMAEERERRRIASELHDSIIQTLVFSKFRLDAIMTRAREAGFGEPLVEVHSHIKKCIQDIRSLILDISPPVLYELGLEEAIESLTRQMQRQHGINISCHDDKKDKPLHNDLKIMLYQAVRELLTNMVKHSGASSSSVSIMRNGTSIIIRVEDDGIGFSQPTENPDDEKRDCYGLFNIRERLGHFGGKMKTGSVRGRGAHIILTAPLLQQ
jgi:signal transduction histidine kinase